MKFSCEKTLLLSAVNTASRTVAVKSSIPALEGILIEATATRLDISGYNMNTGIRTTIEANITEEGTLVVPSRMFGDMIRQLPDDIVSFTSEKNFTAKIICGDTSYNLQTLSAEDYPELPEVEDEYSLRVPQNILRTMINETSFAISTDETRPIHTGSLFEISEEGLTIVSVDGFRLALRREPLENSVSGGSFQFVVPGSALKEVEKICGETDKTAVITLGHRHLLFEIGASQLICRRLEGEFLNYKAAIPRQNPTVITADKKSLTEAIDRVSVVISEKQKSPMRCIFGEDRIDFSARTATNEAKAVCQITGNGNGLEIGFNNRYLMEALKYAPADEVRLELNTSISPCIITPVEGEEKFLYMVLPVRLKNS